MNLPDLQTVMLPLLQALADGELHPVRELSDALSARFRLAEDEKGQRLPGGQQTVLGTRVARAEAYLRRAGLVENPSRGVTRITAAGFDVLAQKPARIDLALLRRFPSYVAYRQRSLAEGSGADVDAPATPEESMESSYRMLRGDLADELLERVRACSPQFFERLVARLLVAMGYGGSLDDVVRAVGRTGDGGVDGIIKADRLGLDVLCILAERRAEPVGSSAVREFAQRVEAFGARKGVFLTTSTFTPEAREFADRGAQKVVLVDGEMLAELMIDHDVGVTASRTYAVKRTDLGFFLEEGT